MPKIFNRERTATFNNRAAHRRNLGQEHGFNIDDEEESADFAAALLTEYSDNESASTMAKLAIVSGYLMGESIVDLQHELSEKVQARIINKKERLLVEMVKSIAGDAARDIRDRWSSPSEQESVVKPKRPTQETNELRINKSDPSDVIKYLFEVGNITPGHAKALLVYFGLARADITSEKIEKDLHRVGTDLRARIQDYIGRSNGMPTRGLKILQAFTLQRQENPLLRLQINDEADMEFIGSELLRIYQPDNVSASDLIGSRQ